MAGRKTIILGVSASIAIYKSCDLVRRLMDCGYAVNVVMTPNAKELIRPVVFQSLSNNKVYHDLFADPDAWEVEHVSLARRAALILIAPATADVIAKISHGICDDMLTCVVSAAKAPVLICPAMNDRMYTNKITQENIIKLKSLKYRFVEPKKGQLACGSIGTGCLADIEAIVKEVKRIVGKSGPVEK